MNKFALSKFNILMIVGGFCLMILGYVLMVGGGSDDPNIFNYEMFNARRLVVAPILIVLGFGVEIFAIMWKPKKKE